jgi:hypothetical protein
LAIYAVHGHTQMMRNLAADETLEERRPRSRRRAVDHFEQGGRNRSGLIGREPVAKNACRFSGQDGSLGDPFAQKRFEHIERLLRVQGTDAACQTVGIT